MTNSTTSSELREIAIDDLATFDFNTDGYIADTAGRYVYRPVRFAEQGRVVVCERVR